AHGVAMLFQNAADHLAGRGVIIRYENVGHEETPGREYRQRSNKQNSWFLAFPRQPLRRLGNSGSRLSLSLLCVSSQVFFQLRNLFLQCAINGCCPAQFALTAKLFEFSRAVAGAFRQENAEGTLQGVGQGSDFVRVLALQRFLQSSDAFGSVAKKGPNHFVQELFVAANAP